MEILKEYSPSKAKFYESRYESEVVGNITRTLAIVEHLLTPYYVEEINKKIIDEYLADLKGIYEHGYGMYSFASVYTPKIDELDDLLKDFTKSNM